MKGLWPISSCPMLNDNPETLEHGKRDNTENITNNKIAYFMATGKMLWKHLCTLKSWITQNEAKFLLSPQDSNF